MVLVIENMEFTEYEKINNSMSKFEDRPEYKKIKCVVTEKIHGANFSFHTDGVIVKIARRRAILADDESFFNYQRAEFMKTYPEKMKEVFSAICKLYPVKNICQVSVFGELFGGKIKLRLNYFQVACFRHNRPMSLYVFIYTRRFIQYLKTISLVIIV